MIGFHNAVQGTPQRSLWDDDGFLVFARGEKGIVASTRPTWASPTIHTQGLRWGGYRCQIHLHLMQLRGEQFQLAIPPRQAHCGCSRDGRRRRRRQSRGREASRSSSSGVQRFMTMGLGRLSRRGR
jgi:hypothetical protein